MTDKLSFLILAAGSSQRLGQPKQMLKLKNNRLISHIVDEALNSDIGKIYVVTGYKNALVEAELRGKGIHFIYNKNWKEGMGSSISTGINNINSDRGVIISVCDQPYISKEIFRTLFEKASTSGKGIVYCEYENGFGPPVFFKRKYLSDLNSLTGDQGAKSLIKKHIIDSASISFPKGSFDLDTPDDYRKFLNTQK